MSIMCESWGERNERRSGGHGVHAARAAHGTRTHVALDSVLDFRLTLARRERGSAECAPRTANIFRVGIPQTHSLKICCPLCKSADLHHSRVHVTVSCRRPCWLIPRIKRVWRSSQPARADHGPEFGIPSWIIRVVSYLLIISARH